MPKNITQKDGLAPRRAALRTIDAIKRGDLQLGDALTQYTARLSDKDRALCRHLVLITLKREGQLKSLVRKCLKRPIPKNAKAGLDILILGVAQLFFAQIPTHAAVSTTVALIGTDKRPAVRALKALSNAVLRRLSGDEGQVWLAEQDSERLCTPKWAWDSWVKAYGEDKTRAIIRTNFETAPLDISPKNKATANHLLENIPASVGLAQGTIRLMQAMPVTQIPGFEDGSWWVQDAAAYLTAQLLRDEKEIWDACAAPGGKTMALASFGAKVFASDFNPGRLKRLKENLTRTGLTAEIIDFDTDERFETVLIDAPCSSTGTIRRHPDVLRSKNAAAVEELSKLQADILDAKMKNVKPGGTLVFATCSLQAEEGELQAHAFLKRHQSWKTKAFTKEDVPGLHDALTANSWLRVTPDLWADQGGLDGFFIARFQAPTD